MTDILPKPDWGFYSVTISLIAIICFYYDKDHSFQYHRSSTSLYRMCDFIMPKSVYNQLSSNAR